MDFCCEYGAYRSGLSLRVAVLGLDLLNINLGNFRQLLLVDTFAIISLWQTSSHEDNNLLQLSMQGNTRILFAPDHLEASPAITLPLPSTHTSDSTGMYHCSRPDFGIICSFHTQARLMWRG